MTDSVFWIWLQEVLGAGSVKADKVVRQLGSPERLFHMSREELVKTGFLASKEVEKILSARSLDHAKETLRAAAKVGCRVITPDHPEYPANLANIDCMPCVLYVMGDLSGLDDRLTLAMVGTRTSNDYGIAAAQKLSCDLAAAGCVIVSGLAMGIDFASHEGALAAKGRTIGMLACGLDVDYPATSNKLKRRILDAGGALITEYPFGEPAYRYNFAVRNRLLSGISSGVVVVQAPSQSGALITARHALDQNRDVFAVPGGIFDRSMTGCNMLIRDGAKIVVNVFSILEEYKNRLPGTVDLRPLIRQARGAMPQAPVVPRREAREVAANPPKQAPRALPERLDEQALMEIGVSAPAQKVYGLLGSEPRDCEYLCASSGIAVTGLMAALTELELFGLAETLPGKRYALAAQ